MQTGSGVTSMSLSHPVLGFGMASMSTMPLTGVAVPGFAPCMLGGAATPGLVREASGPAPTGLVTPAGTVQPGLVSIPAVGLQLGHHPALLPAVQGTTPVAVPSLMLAPPLPGDPSQAALYQQLLQQQAMVTSHSTLQAAQAYDESKCREIHEDIKKLQVRFKLDDRITRDLDTQMKKRTNTFDDDMKAVLEIMGGARNPAGLLRVKIREMEDGTFRGTLTPDKDVEELAKKFNLDAQASAKLADVLANREDKKKDLKQLQKHLELSNKPSSLVMLLLKDIRNGLPIRDPEHPPAVGSAAQRRGMKGGRRSRSRGRRRQERSSSSSPPRSAGAGPVSGKVSSSGPEHRH
eukprot:TRINITY_DN34507_c0_g1_i2.p1 TRINITY_DN34507_c0_g1~~TRINITY_DN34507_c0_g1_i2.p1  ORF type:complete len:349 (+),score=64.26 TRINITY_DN34507_c0_g1_i2:68-1114(+)